MKTKDAICGGYTSKNWDGSAKYVNDTDAFVFNMTNKFATNSPKYAIYTYANGFCFGNDLLANNGLSLNNENEGICKTGKDKFYDIEGTVSLLTNQKYNFTISQLEVFKIIS